MSGTDIVYFAPTDGGKVSSLNEGEWKSITWEDMPTNHFATGSQIDIGYNSTTEGDDERLWAATYERGDTRLYLINGDGTKPTQRQIELFERFWNLFGRMGDMRRIFRAAGLKYQDNLVDGKADQSVLQRAWWLSHAASNNHG